MTAELKTGKAAGWDEYDKYSLGELDGLGFDSVKLDNNWIILEPENIKVIKKERIRKK
jgi:hypothetical protein